MSWGLAACFLLHGGGADIFHSHPHGPGLPDAGCLPPPICLHALMDMPHMAGGPATSILMAAFRGKTAQTTPESVDSGSRNEYMLPFRSRK